MSGFFGKLFGKKTVEANTAAALVEDVLSGLFEVSEFAFSFDLQESEDKQTILIEIYGDDEELLRARDGQLLDAIQLFLTRVVQHQLKDERVSIQVDNAGFREQANQELTSLAEKLKNVALEKGKPVYFRALPPRDRKVIHQFLATDGRVKSRSIGEGLFKKIKIYPARAESLEDRQPDERQPETM
jgi:spoIIIJ-associated protein